MRASNLSSSALHGSRDGTERQSAWTHCTSANWRLLSIKMDFGAKAQGRNNYFVPMLSELPEMLLGGDRWGAGWAQVSWTLPGDRQCLCGSHHWSGATVRNGKPQISLGPNVLRMITPKKTAFWMLCFLPLLPFFLMALGSLADTHNFQAANHRTRKTCQSNNETEKVFSLSGTSGFLWISLCMDFSDRLLNITALNITMKGRVCDKVRERRSLFRTVFAVYHWFC